METLADLRPDMVLEGVITNVTNFGAFVDVGVHQDGLVHISAMSDRFVKDPREVVKAGEVVKVKVMEVDLQRKRIGLSMRLADQAGKGRAKRDTDAHPKPRSRAQRRPEAGATHGALAAAFARARKD